jgi:hypothetical protein
MTNYSNGQNSLLYQGYVESDWISGDPCREAVDQARRNHEEVALLDIQPSVTPRGKSIDAKRKLMEAIVDKVGVRTEYDAWLSTRNVDASKSFAPEVEAGRSMPLTYDFTPDLQPRATGIGEMWWARTDWSWPGSGNGTTSTMDLRHPDVWHAASKTIFAGVLIFANEHVWTADTPTGDQIAAWTQLLEEMKALEPDLVVPGHRTPDAAADVTAIDRTRDYLAVFQEVVAAVPDGAATEALIRRYPAAGMQIAAQIGPKVAKNEMKWG